MQNYTDYTDFRIIVYESPSIQCIQFCSLCSTLCLSFFYFLNKLFISRIFGQLIQSIPFIGESLIEFCKEISQEMVERNRRIILAVRDGTHAWDDGNRMLW